MRTALFSETVHALHCEAQAARSVNRGCRDRRDRSIVERRDESLCMPTDTHVDDPSM